MKFIEPKNKLTVLVDESVIRQISEQAISEYPQETGGFLVGYYCDNFQTAVITKQIPPLNSKTTVCSFIREASGLKDIWESLNEQGLFYVGEWHTHPNGSTAFSNTDFNAMKNIYNDEGIVIERPLLMIVSVAGDGVMDQALYHFDNKKNKLQEYGRF